jgi:hypothetical protein
MQCSDGHLPTRAYELLSCHPLDRDALPPGFDRCSREFVLAGLTF